MITDQGLVTPPYKDRKTGLIVFGVFEILLGCIALLMLLAIGAGQLMLALREETAGKVDLQHVLPSLALFAGGAAIFIWLGIGSIRARRWARALSLCLGWIWLLTGIVSCVTFVWMLLAIDDAMRQGAAQSGQQLPAAAAMIAKIVLIGFVVLFYLIIPAGLILFYRSRHVKLTCEARDLVERWTDRCPLPVLAMVLLHAFGAVVMLLMLPAYGRVFPFFGIMLKGAPAFALYVGFAVLSGYLALGFYRLQRRALWIYMGVIVVFGINGLVAFCGGGLMTYYENLGLPDAQLQQIKAMPFLRSSALVWIGAVAAVLFLGYLWWLKRFFGAPRDEIITASP